MIEDEDEIPIDDSEERLKKFRKQVRYLRKTGTLNTRSIYDIFHDFKLTEDNIMEHVMKLTGIDRAAVALTSDDILTVDTKIKILLTISDDSAFLVEPTGCPVGTFDTVFRFIMHPECKLNETYKVDLMFRWVSYFTHQQLLSFMSSIEKQNVRVYAVRKMSKRRNMLSLAERAAILLESRTIFSLRTYVEDCRDRIPIPGWTTLSEVRAVVRRSGDKERVQQDLSHLLQEEIKCNMGRMDPWRAPIYAKKRVLKIAATERAIYAGGSGRDGIGYVAVNRILHKHNAGLPMSAADLVARVWVADRPIAAFVCPELTTEERIDLLDRSTADAIRDARAYAVASGPSAIDILIEFLRKNRTLTDRSRGKILLEFSDLLPKQILLELIGTLPVVEQIIVVNRLQPGELSDMEGLRIVLQSESEKTVRSFVGCRKGLPRTLRKLVRAYASPNGFNRALLPEIMASLAEK